MIVFINRCDEDELLFLKTMVSIHKEYYGLLLSDIVEISTYVVLIHKYSTRLKELSKRQLSENEYYEYQLAVQYVSKYLSKLNNMCSIHGIDIEKLLMLVGSRAVFDESTLRDFQGALGLLGSASFIYSNMFNPDCSRPLIDVIVEVWKNIARQEHERCVFIIVPNALTLFLEKHIPRDHIIGI